MQNNNRQQITYLALLSLFIMGMFVATSPTVTHAQDQAVSIDLADCATTQRQSTTKAKNDVALTETKQLTENFLLNAFTYQTLNQRLRCDPLIVGVLDDQGKPTTTSIYKTSQNLVNFGVLVALLIIAFANILPLKIETYAVKKAVPMLVLGVVLANLALPMIRTVVDFSGVLTATLISSATPEQTRTAFVEQLVSTVYKGGAAATGDALRGIATGNGGLNAAIGIVGFGVALAGATGPFFVALFVGVLFLITLPSIIFLYLGILFVARIYVLVILTATSPIAFASIGFEPLKGKIWAWWWKQFINWTFMAPATFFLMWVSIRFYQAVNEQPDIGTYVLTLALLFLAAQIPTKMGGTIISKWNDTFAAPLRSLALKPFTSAKDYVQKAAPRDLSRFASNRGLNPVKFASEFGAAVEKKNAERETYSKSAGAGRFYGTIRGSMQNVWSKQERDEAWANRFNNSDVREEFRKKSQMDIIKRYHLDQSMIEDKTTNAGNNEDIRSALEKDREAVKAGTITEQEKIRNIILNHGQLGGKLSDIDATALFEKIQNPALRDDLKKLYAAYYTRKTDDPYSFGTSPAELSKANESRDEQNKVKPDEQFSKDLAALGNRIANAISTAAENKKEKEYLTRMLDQLRTMNINLNDLGAIEKDINALATVKALLKYGKNAPTDGQNSSTMAEIEQHRAALGVIRIEKLISSPSGAALAAAINHQRQERADSGGSPFVQLDLNQLQGLLSQGTNHDPAQSQAIREAIENTKELRDFLKHLLTTSLSAKLDVGDLDRLVNHVLPEDGIPTKLHAEAIRSIVSDKNKASPAIAQEIAMRAESYNNAVDQINEAKAMQQITAGHVTTTVNS